MPACVLLVRRRPDVIPCWFCPCSAAGFLTLEAVTLTQSPFTPLPARGVPAPQLHPPPQPHCRQPPAPSQGLAGRSGGGWRLWAGAQ